MQINCPGYYYRSVSRGCGLAETVLVVLGYCTVRISTSTRVVSKTPKTYLHSVLATSVLDAVPFCVSAAAVVADRM